MQKLKLYTLFALSSAPLLQADHRDGHGITLESPIIEFIDGRSFAVDGKAIKLIIQVRREIRKIQCGEQTKGGSLEGHYQFNDGLYSVHALAALESEYDAEFYQKEAFYKTDLVRYQQELDKLNAWYSMIKTQLRECLEKAKKEFAEKVAPFAKSARGAKAQMLILIAESCKKRNRDDCFLLKWAEADEGNEFKIFFDQVITFKACDQFCTDLVNFLEDLMRSCPKAWAQFKKLMEKHNNPR